MKESHLGETRRFAEDGHPRDANEADVKRLFARILDGDDVKASRLADELARQADERLNNRATTVYRLFNGDGELLYVGITNRGYHRLKEHAADKDWWQEVATATFEHCSDRPSAMRQEAKAIRSEEPRYNVVVPVGERARWVPEVVGSPNSTKRRVRGTHGDKKALIGSADAWHTLNVLARRHFKSTAADVVRSFEAGDLDNDPRLPLVLGMLSLVELPIEEFGK